MRQSLAGTEHGVECLIANTVFNLMDSDDSDDNTEPGVMETMLEALMTGSGFSRDGKSKTRRARLSTSDVVDDK